MSQAAADHPHVPFPPPLLFALGFLTGWLLHRRWPLAFPAAGGFFSGFGWVLVAGGLGFMLAGLITFLRARTAVIPHRPASRLVTWGPYRRTRNPMYLGLTLAYLGGSCLMADFWPLLLLPAVLLILTRFVIQREERYLRAAFGPDYQAYTERVRRWL